MSPKLSALLQSRKFWTLVTALVTVGGGVATGQMPYDQAALAAVGALSAYTLGTSIEAHGQAIAASTVPHG